jgi:Uma2 family endonuclease
VPTPTLQTTVIIRGGDHVDTERLFEEACAEYPSGKVEQQANGDVILMAPTGIESSDRNAEIVMQLRQWAKKDGRGRVFESNALYIFPDRSKKGPDASWVHRDKILALSPRERKEFPQLVPDFVIELQPPSDRLSDLQEKMRAYRRLGVTLGWLIDPEKRQVLIYSDPSEAVVVLDNPEIVHGAGPVAGFVLDMADIWTGLNF